MPLFLLASLLKHTHVHIHRDTCALLHSSTPLAKSQKGDNTKADEKLA